MHTSSTSCVIGTDGIRSVSTLESRMTRQEYSVNRRPISLKLITAGIALSSRLMSVNGSAMPANRCALRWISRVSPLNPPGNRPPASTKLWILAAMMTDASTINSSLRQVSAAECRRAGNGNTSRSFCLFPGMVTPSSLLSAVGFVSALIIASAAGFLKRGRGCFPVKFSPSCRTCRAFGPAFCKIRQRLPIFPKLNRLFTCCLI